MEEKYGSVVSVIGRIKLAREMELISHLDLMLSMDSSAMHMASLVGVPVVSVWGATHPYAGFYGIGQDPQNAVQLDMACRPCSIYGNRPCAYGDYPCMRGIAPEQIVGQVCKAAGTPFGRRIRILTQYQPRYNKDEKVPQVPCRDGADRRPAGGGGGGFFRDFLARGVSSRAG